jgi:hypothetical protein
VADESCKVENFHNGSELTCELIIRRCTSTLGVLLHLLGTIVTGLPTNSCLGPIDGMRLIRNQLLPTTALPYLLLGPLRPPAFRLALSQNVVWYVVRTCCERTGLEHIAPHDLRRTCAKLCTIASVSLSRFSSCSGMHQCRPRNAISAANRISGIQ